MISTVLWDVVPWSLIEASPTFQFTYFPHLELYSEDGASRFPRNVSKFFQTTRRHIGKKYYSSWLNHT